MTIKDTGTHAASMDAYKGETQDLDTGGTRGHQGGGESGSSPARSEFARVWLISLACALLAGVIGWLASSVADGYWHWVGRLNDAESVGRDRRDPVFTQKLAEARIAAETKNTALALGIFGGVLGLTFGAAGGFCRGSNRLALLGGMIGLALVAAAAVAASFQIAPLLFKYMGKPPNPSAPLICHTALYAIIGGMGGLVFGVGFKGWSQALRAMLAGAMGAALGSIVYNVTHTIAFPLEWDFSPLPGKETSRLIAHLCAAVFSMVCIVAVLGGQKTVAQGKYDKTGLDS
jgi:hypothetical protein